MFYNLLNKSAVIIPLLVLLIQSSVALILPESKPVQYALGQLEEKMKLSSNSWRWIKYKTRVGLIRGVYHRNIIVTLVYLNPANNESVGYDLQLKKVGLNHYELEGIKKRRENKSLALTKYTELPARDLRQPVFKQEARYRLL